MIEVINMSSPAMRLTRAGKMVLARGLAGAEIKFTRVGLGSGEFDYETESVFELTELRHWEQNLPLTKVEVKGDGLVYIEAFQSNAEVLHGYACREHGLFAIDQDTGEEILYSYKNVGEEYDFIPSATGSAHKNLKVSYESEISDAENVTAVLDLSVAYVNAEDFDAHVNSAHPHLNTPNHYLDITEADCIWATDNDSHLHKITVEDLKAQLKDEPLDTVSDFERIMTAKAELGLDANILLVEDFTGDSTLDNFSVKVTSSAENGRLLGVGSVDGLLTGNSYVISDGFNAELVTLDSIVYNMSGRHVRLAEPLINSYDWSSTTLFRTAHAGAERKSFSWASDTFYGVEANSARTLTLSDKAQDFDITGDGFIVDGFFTLG